MALAHQCSGRRLGRIASVLLAVAVPATAQQPVTSFIPASPTFDVRAWEPMAPAPGNEIDSADKLGFLNSRALLDTPRGAEAAADDVYDPAAVAPRFADALGLTLTTQNAPATLGLIARLVKDAEVLVAPIKAMRPPAGTGRVRPFVAYPNTPHCPLTAGDTAADLPDTGSYPSTHAMLGWIWASVLIAGAPDRADQLLARGIAFGDSRVVCGFHYSSDVTAGRLAAAALMARVAVVPAYQQALIASRKEIKHLRTSQL